MLRLCKECLVYYWVSLYESNYWRDYVEENIKEDNHASYIKHAVCGTFAKWG